MRLLFTLFTLAGPILGFIGFFADIPVMFWIGACLAGINLVMNLASGVMKLPVLPVLCVVGAAAFFSPWHVGAALGLLAYTAVEGVGELPSAFS